MLFFQFFFQIMCLKSDFLLAFVQNMPKNGNWYMAICKLYAIDNSTGNRRILRAPDIICATVFIRTRKNKKAVARQLYY